MTFGRLIKEINIATDGGRDGEVRSPYRDYEKKIVYEEDIVLLLPYFEHGNTLLRCKNST